MRLLVATRQGQGLEAEDYDDGVIAGELVEPMQGCWDTDDPDAEGCGCESQFVGATSRNVTTTAVVAECPDIDRDTLTDIIAGLHNDSDADTINGFVEDLISYGQAYPVGTVVAIYKYEIRSHL